MIVMIGQYQYLPWLRIFETLHMQTFLVHCYVDLNKIFLDSKICTNTKSLKPKTRLKSIGNTEWRKNFRQTSEKKIFFPSLKVFDIGNKILTPLTSIVSSNFEIKRHVEFLKFANN